MFSAELRQQDVPDHFHRFSHLIGERTWLEQVERMRAAIQHNPLLAEYLPRQNALSLALETCSRASAMNEGRLPWSLTARRDLLEAHTFAFQTLGLIEAARQMSAKRARTLVARVQDAFKNPRALHAMQLEARVATHFVRRGHEIRFPELGHGKETFDLLVETLGARGLEVECKVVTIDKGRKVHREEAFAFHHQLQPLVDRTARQIQTGIALVVTVPGRMPGDHDCGNLVRAVERQLVSGQQCGLHDGVEVRVIDFRPEALGQLARPLSPQNVAAVERITGTANRETMVYRPAGHPGTVIVVLQSSEPDSVLHEVFATLADSAARMQLTGTRPGLFIAGFEDLEARKLSAAATDDGVGGQYSALAHQASQFLEREDFPHVVGVGFFSAPDFRESADTHEAGGSAYYFPKPTSPQWRPEFSGLFGRDPRALQAA